MKSGHWPLFRFSPERQARGLNPLQLDSRAPSEPYRRYMESETRFAMLWNSHPDTAEKLAAEAQAEVDQRYRHYQQLAAMQWEAGETMTAARAQVSRRAPDSKEPGTTEEGGNHG